MAEAALQRMTVAEFLQFEDGTDTRYELADGSVRAMAPPAGPHGAIAVNVAALLHRCLRDRRPCRGQAEAGIKIDETTWWQADLAVTCHPAAPWTAEPLLIVEIMSPSTRAHDVLRKLPDYKGIGSVQEVWLIDSERRWAQIWRRDRQGWVGRDHVGGGSFDSGVLEITVNLDEVYEVSGL